jgi:putative hydrolase of the HAD superfamily
MAGMTQSPNAMTMKSGTPISCLFLDIGDVLLTDGWDHRARKRAATTFGLKSVEMEDRHHMTFETFEDGKLTLDEYLGLVVFYQKRPFSRAKFRRFMFAQSKACAGMIDLFAQIKVRYGVKIIALSNEARELNAYRIRAFKLNKLIDAFVCSCFVQMRKPDAAIFRLALDIAQTPIREIVYIDNTPMFVHIAETLGIQSILHTDYESTRTKLAALELYDDKGGVRGTR